MNATVPAQPIRTQARLADHAFVDLYIAIGDGAPGPIIKGLRPKGQITREGPTGMIPVPGHLRDDTITLAKLIWANWKATGGGPQTSGAREFTITHHEVAYRCSLIAPPEEGVQRPRKPSELMNWCIRHLSNMVPDIRELGHAPDLVRDLLALRKERGLLLVSGSFGSGKTTTASAVLDQWVSLEREIAITLEDPPELPMARVTEDRGAIYQVDLTEKPFHVAIKHSRRWAPRYMFLGEIRTPEAAAELLHMSISGPMVLCTIHAADEIQAIVSLCRFASVAMSERSAREMVAASLHSVLYQQFTNQRLVSRMVTIAGDENFGIRNKIENGQFQRIYEDIERQKVNRAKNTAR